MSLVTVAAESIPGWQQNLSDIELRIFADLDFLTSDDVEILHGDATNYLRVPCSYNSTTKILTISAFSINSTTDARQGANEARYVAWFYRSTGKRLKLFDNLPDGFKVPPTPASTTWDALIAYNRLSFPNRDFSAYSKQESDRTRDYLLSLIGTVTNPVLSGVPTASLPTTSGALQIASDGRRTFTIGNGSEAVPIIGAVNVKLFSCKGDAVIVTDGAMSSSGSTVTCATSTPFVVGRDEGKLIDVQDCGATATSIRNYSGVNNKSGVITAVLSTSQVVVSFTATVSVTGKKVTFGTDDTAALQAAFAAAAENWAVYFPPGNYAHNGQISINSSTRIYGEGRGVSVLTQIGPQRNVASGIATFSVANGVENVTVQSLSIRGTNYTTHLTGINCAQEVTSTDNYTYGVRIGTGSTGDIQNVTLWDVEIGYLWGMGLRSDGDTDQDGVSAPSVLNINVLDCHIHHVGDNCININSGGGLSVLNTRMTHSANGVEFGGSRLQLDNCYSGYHSSGGLVPTGLGNPAEELASYVRNCTVEYIGTGGNGSGIGVGTNAIGLTVSGCTVRKCGYIGIYVLAAGADFGNKLRNITIESNVVYDNGTWGIKIDADGVIVRDNDVFGEQTIGIAVTSGDRVRLIANRALNNTDHDYTYSDATNLLFIRHESESDVSVGVSNISGTVDTSGTAVTWKTGSIFRTEWAGCPIVINSVTYLISAVAAHPSGNCSISGNNVTRTSGPVYTSAMVGLFIKLGATRYWQIASVADGSHLAVTPLYGSPTAGSGIAWELYGSTGMTLLTTAGTQSGVTYSVGPHVIFPSASFDDVLFTGSEIQTPITVTDFSNLAPAGYRVVKYEIVAAALPGLQNGTPGQRLTLIFTYATGGWFIGFSTYRGGANIYTTANKATVMELIYDSGLGWAVLSQNSNI